MIIHENTSVSTSKTVKINLEIVANRILLNASMDAFLFR